MSNNPMQKPPTVPPMHLSPRCAAKSKRSKVRCRSPAVNGWKVCRMHGARGGAPPGKPNGNYRNGYYTQETKANQREFRDSLRGFKAFLSEVDQ
jgi:hypothetical protein